MPTFPAPTFAETEFRKASRSEPNGDCVEVARRGGRVAIRDSKTAFGAAEDHHLQLSADAFDRALTAWRANRDG